MSKILVTGGAGYIGSHLTKQLLEAGHDVVILDCLYYGSEGMRKWKDHPRVHFIEGDICNIKDLVRAMKGVSEVIALAAIVGDPACELDHDETLSSNYESTKILAEIAKFQKVKRIVFASSCSVYGANSQLVMNEGSWLNPVSLYAETRIRSEKVLMSYLDDVEVVILRLATVFGVSDRMRFDLVLNILCAKAFFEQKIDIYGKEQFRPLVHGQDVARAFLLASQAPTEKVNGQVFNVGSNAMNFTIGQIGEAVLKHFPLAKLNDHSIVDHRDYRVDFSKIKSLLGFEPAFDLDRGVREIKGYLEENPKLTYLDDIYYNVKYLFKK